MGVYLLCWLWFVFGVTSQIVTQVAIVEVYVQPEPTTSFNPTQVEVVTIVETSNPTTGLDAAIYSYTGTYSLNTTFAEQMLDLHNTKRGLHGATDVHWNNTLFDYAAAYASKYDCSGVLTHSGGLYGENLAIGYSTDGAMEAWYDEGNNFPYGTESEYNHFTQVIWNGSTSIGCSPKYCNSVWGTYIICSYFPAGNVIGYESENVFPPI